MSGVLVTGGSGFVGSTVIARLIEAGKPVVAALRQPSSKIPPSVRQVIVGEIGPATDWREALEGVGSVIHLAARVHVMQETESDPDAAFERVNGEGTRQLAESAAHAGVRRMIFVSSIKVNGERTPIDYGFAGDQAPAPEDAYGRSKLSGERWVRHAMGGGSVILRPPLVYGPGVGGNLAMLLKAVSRGWPLPLGAIENRRSLIARDNLASAILAALDHPSLGARTFTLADGSDYSTPDLIRALAQAMGKRANLWPIPVGALKLAAAMLGKSGAVDRLTGSLVVNPTSFMTATGWRPLVTPEAAIAEMAAAYRQA